MARRLSYVALNIEDLCCSCISLHIKSIFLHHFNWAEVCFVYLPSNVHDEGAERPMRTNPTPAGGEGGRAHEPQRRGGDEGVEEHEGSRHAAGTAGRAPEEPSNRPEPCRRPT